MAIIAVANQKGGVGKTATVANLGAALSLAGKSVLLIDLDSQANLTLSCGIQPDEGQPTAYDLLMDETVSLADTAISTPWDNLYIVPGSENLAAAQVQLTNEADRNERLAAKLEAAGGYDYVLIDTPPSLGFLTLNALTAADWVLIPVQASFLALHGLRQLLQTVQAVQAHSNASLSIGGVVLTMYDSRTLHAQQVRERVLQNFGDRVFNVMVRRSVAFDYATVAGQPLVFYQPGHPSALVYGDLAREVIARA